MKINCGTQFRTNCFDIFNIGFYKDKCLFSICFTLLGFQVDFDFGRKELVKAESLKILRLKILSVMEAFSSNQIDWFKDAKPRIEDLLKELEEE